MSCATLRDHFEGFWLHLLDPIQRPWAPDLMASIAPYAHEIRGRIADGRWTLPEPPGLRRYFERTETPIPEDDRIACVDSGLSFNFGYEAGTHFAAYGVGYGIHGALVEGAWAYTVVRRDGEAVEGPLGDLHEAIQRWEGLEESRRE